MRKYFDIAYGDDAEQKLDLYLPEGKSNGVFVFFHGGGLVDGDKHGSDSNVERFGEIYTSNGIAFISANYRMYPRAKYPDFIVDAANAVAWAKENREKYGIGEKLYVGGSSAGGYLSMMLCYDKKYLGAHGIDPLEVTAYIHDAGQPTTHFNVCTERGLNRYRCIVDEAAPVYHVGDAEEYAPQLILVADNDIKARYEQTMLLIATYNSLGYDKSKIELKYMRGYTHTGYTFEFNENGESTFCNIVLEYIEGLEKSN